MSSQFTIDAGHNLQEIAETVLVRRCHFAHRSLQVTIEDDSLILRGTVSTYYQKQMAQESVRGIEGISRVCNEIEVTS